MSQAQAFTDANFQQEVLQSDQPVLVDFWAAWCGPCRAVGPTIDELAEQFDGQVKIGKVNVDENQQSAQQYGISSIPAVLLFQNGEVVRSILGAQPKETYVQAIEQLST